jgi:hypothetical protein
MHYKFLDSAHVSNVLVEGTIVISSFEYFRRLEETEWGGIADRLDAATELKIPEHFVATENSPELEQLNNANIGLALQLSFCFEVRTLSDRLVSSAP